MRSALYGEYNLSVVAIGTEDILFRPRMTWDADGNRITFTSSTGGTTDFVYDTTAGIPAVIEEVVEESHVYYVREPDGALIARVSGSDIGYYHFDALGSTRLSTDSAGNVTDTYSYDAWGNATHETGSTGQPYQYVGQLGYYTHYQDVNLPLLQLGVRFYDPEIGRFTQRDGIRRKGANAFAYAADSPMHRTDPTGMREEGGGELTVPEFVPDKISCKGMDRQFDMAAKYAKLVVDTLSLNCPKTIQVRCWKSCWITNELGLGGFSIPSVGMVIWGPIYIGKNRVYPYCQILHEMIHMCGRLGHSWMDEIEVPGCQSQIL